MLIISYFISFSVTLTVHKIYNDVSFICKAARGWRKPLRLWPHLYKSNANWILIISCFISFSVASTVYEIYNDVSFICEAARGWRKPLRSWPHLYKKDPIFMLIILYFIIFSVRLLLSEIEFFKRFLLLRSLEARRGQIEAKVIEVNLLTIVFVATFVL